MLNSLENQTSVALRYVQESDDPFLALFPHRFDYIYAKHPDPGQKPDWKTETRYPLSDRLIQQGAYLYGVRFGKQTQYCLLDIDINSPYHPRRDALAISRLVASLEPLGLTSYIACQSSNSGGLHLYFPFEPAQPSWKLAAAVTALLSNSGFKLNPGQLEVFPNPKPYVAGGHPTRFNAHRLPLQAGFWLLNSAFEPVWSDRLSFVNQWQFAEAKNDLTEIALERVLKQAKRQPYQVSHRAEKFLNDLNAEIEVGWTGYGQTNWLLGRIALRTYVFHPVLCGGMPLTGQALVNEVVQIARSLPGYGEWCQHQHEIVDRVEEWVRCVENSHYFPYGSKKSAGSIGNIQPDDPGNSLTWNQKQSNATREKIKAAIGSLLETNSLPSGITDRFRELTQFGISGTSLYRHRDLWHPNDLSTNQEDPLENLLEDDKTDCKDSFKVDRSTNPLNDPVHDPSSDPHNDPDRDQVDTPKSDPLCDPLNDLKRENLSNSIEPQGKTEKVNSKDWQIRSTSSLNLLPKASDSCT
ncbi:hypothetical protein C7B61_19550, partial [filamentous cyanobacterium CCP1]